MTSVQRSRLMYRFVAITTAFFVPAVTYAQGTNDTQPSGSGGFIDKVQEGVNTAAKAPGLDKNGDLFNMIGNAINVALSLVGILLLGYLIYAGFLYMTAGGAEDKIKTANKIIRNSIIGLVILVFAFAISTQVLRMLVKVGG